MVSDRIVSRHFEPVPTQETERKIKGLRGPLYPVEDVLDILSKSSARAWSIGCIKDLQKWEMDESDVDDLVRLAVQSGRYIGSEWCQSKQDGPWAACDAYSVTRKEWSEPAHKDLSIEYYVKLAISKTGQIILLASCHPSEN